MWLPVSSKEYLYIGVDAPAGTNVTDYVPEIALAADDGSEPAEADWHVASWIAGEAALLVGPGGDVEYPAGEYMAFCRVTAGAERPVMRSGRVRIGDTRP